MSFGKMNTFIDIIATQSVEDEDGYDTETEVVVASVRAYREGRHGSKKWANMAVYSEATELFQFRCIPNITVNTSMTIENNGQRFEITSVENIKGRGMYLEVLAKTKTQGG
jgi:head-tail adaptor